LAVLCLAPRLARLNAPPLEEGHAWRQAVTAMIARDFYRHGHRLLYPEVDMVHWQEAGVIDPRPGYTDPELPLFPWLVSFVYHLSGVRMWVARLAAALCGVVSVLCLYALGLELYGGGVGVAAALFYCLTPIAVFYGRAILPEPMMYALIPLAVWQLVVWARQDERARRAYWVAMVAASLAAMLKNTTLHLEIPTVIGCAIAHGPRAWKRADCWALVLVPLVTTFAWYDWAYHLGQAYYSEFAIVGGRAAANGLVNPNLWLKGEANFYPRFLFVMLLLVGNVTGWLMALLGLGRGGHLLLVLLADLLEHAHGLRHAHALGKTGDRGGAKGVELVAVGRGGVGDADLAGLIPVRGRRV